MSDLVDIGDVERALWSWSGWRADQRGVDAVLEVVRRYGETGAKRAAQDILAQARREAEQIVQSARDEVAAQKAVQKPATRRVGGLGHAPRYTTPIKVTPRPRAVPQPPREADEPETHRTCSRCRKTKAIDLFNRDRKSHKGRKAQCKWCESERRKERRDQKRADTREMAA